MKRKTTNTREFMAVFMAFLGCVALYTGVVAQSHPEQFNAVVAALDSSIQSMQSYYVSQELHYAQVLPVTAPPETIEETQRESMLQVFSKEQTRSTDVRSLGADDTTSLSPLPTPEALLSPLPEPLLSPIQAPCPDDQVSCPVVNVPSVPGMEFQINTYDGPEGSGYEIVIEYSANGTLWRRVINHGPEEWREQDWKTTESEQ